MAQLIDLGKLRFHFAGQWSSTTQYELNDIVKYGGNVYLYVYTLATVGNLPTDNSFWTILVEGIRFQGAYDEGAAYKVGDGMAYGGVVYICVHDSQGNNPPNPTYWSQFADGVQYEGQWSNSANYQKNDIVVWGGNTYIAKQDSTNHKPNDISYWDPFIQGVDATGVYNPATTYVPNQLVVYGNTYYICNNETTGNPPTDTDYWSLYLQGLGPQGVWSETTTYYKNDIVIDGSTVYIYKYDTPSDGHPVTAIEYWQVLTSGIHVRGDWAPSTQYYSGDVVVRGGSTYITSQFHASSINFATDLSDGKWTKYNSGVRYRGAWAAHTDYIEGDIITDGENARIANMDFTSGSYLADNESSWDMLAKGATGILPAMGGKAGYVLGTDGAVASFTRDIAAMRFGNNTDAADFETAASLTDTAGVFVQGSDSFIQLAIANKNNGTSSSTDFIAYTHDGTNGNGWVDLGITGDAFSATEFGITGPNEGYIFMSAPRSNEKVVTHKVITSNVATITANGHGYSNGNVIIVNIGDDKYDGKHTIVSHATNTISFASPNYASSTSTDISDPMATVWRPNGTGNLVLATDNSGTDNKLVFAAGGFASGRSQMYIAPDEQVHISIDTVSTSPTTGALTVVGGVGITGDQYIAGNLTVIGNVDLQGVTKLPVGSGATAYETSAGLSNAVIIAAGNATDFVQNALVNLGTGISSSADYIAYAKEGDNGSGWIDMGITNNSFSDPMFGITGNHDGYIFMSAPAGTDGNGNLVLATDSTGQQNKIIFAAGGYDSGRTQMEITPDSSVKVNISTPSISPTTGAFQVVGGVGISGDMNVAGNVNITGTIKFGGSGTTVQTDNLAVVSPMVFVATGNPTGDGLSFAFLGESRSARIGLTLTSAVNNRQIASGVATLVTSSSHSYEKNDSVVVTGVDDLANPQVVIVYEITGTTTAKLTTATAHGLTNGQQIDIVGVDSAVNGTSKTILSTPTTTTLTYAISTASVTPPSPVSSGTVQRVNLPNVFNGTYTITDVPTPTTFTYARGSQGDVALSAPTRVYSNVVSYSLTGGVVTLVLNAAPQVSIGNSITVSGVTSLLNGVRTVTGVSGSVPYSISYARTLDDISSTTLTNVVSATVTSRNRTSNVSTITTSADHGFVIGEAVTVAGVSATFNGTFTITATPATNKFSYSQTASNVDETAGGGTASVTRANFGSYAKNGYTGTSVVTNPLRGQYTGLARNQATQKWHIMGGLSSKPSTTIDFSVPGTTFTRNTLNVDILESRATLLDKDPWNSLHAITQQAAMIVPQIVTTSQSLLARQVNTVEGNSVASGFYMFNVSTSGQTFSLPASPNVGATIVMTDISGNAISTPFTISRNGNLIQGAAEDLIFNVNLQSLKLVYAGSTFGWVFTL